MSVSVDEFSPISEGRSTAVDDPASIASKSSADSVSLGKNGITDAENSEAGTPKPHPMAFTIDFGEAKKMDKSRLEELAKKSQARHQRVQSMSTSLTSPGPLVHKPPLSAKLPRKAQGYNSEGYFSSDQEDCNLSGSVKLGTPLAQNMAMSCPTNRHHWSPVNDFQPAYTSKSPIVDSIMSRSDNFTSHASRQGLNLPLKHSNGYYLRDVHRTPSYGNLTYRPRPIETIIDNSPDGVMLTDISSPELDILTPDNGLSTPERSPRKIGAVSRTPDLLYQKCAPKVEYVEDDVDIESNHSSTGTYTIEGDNYTEEQKARMSIDRDSAVRSDDKLDGTIENTLKLSINERERDPALIFDFPNEYLSREPRRESQMRNKLTLNSSFDIPLHDNVVSNKTADMPVKSNDKNFLEISCCYESPTDNDLAAQTSKQIRSTRSYLEKIKSRVRTITEKTLAKPQSSKTNVCDEDVGSFTSVTASGVLSKGTVNMAIPQRRRCSLTKSEVDQTDYIHRLSRESSEPLYLPCTNAKSPLVSANFESTALKSAQKALKGDVIPRDLAEDQVVGKLSYLSLNRCKGDKTWIQDWAESVKKYNNTTLGTPSDTTILLDKPPPASPKHLDSPRALHGGSPSKTTSPVSTLFHRRTPDLIPSQDTESYLLKTQNAITNLQAKLHSNRSYQQSSNPPQVTSSVLSDSRVSRLPVPQLSRSNSLNYRLRRKDSDGSPLRSPGHYVVTGSKNVPDTRKLLKTLATKSLDTDCRDSNSNLNSPNSDKGLSNSSDDKTLSNRPKGAEPFPHRRTHVRHKSFDGENTPNYISDCKNANQTVCLKTVLKNNAFEQYPPRIEPTRCQDTTKKHQRVFSDGNRQFQPYSSGIKRSSSFNTVNKNNNYMTQNTPLGCRKAEFNNYLTDESDNEYEKAQILKHNRLHRNRIDSPDLKTAPAISARCPNTPEMQRKFGPGLVRSSVRVTNKERAGSARMSEPPKGKEERSKSANPSPRISEPTRQAVFNRLTKSRSSTREFQPKPQQRGPKRPVQHRSSSALATKELEFNKWKKRASYDPMKAAQEGKKRQQMAKTQECNKDDSSLSQSSPVHRSQSFHAAELGERTMDYSSEEDDLALPSDPMVTSTHSDILDFRPKEERSRNVMRHGFNNEFMLSNDYVTSFQVNQQPQKPNRRDADKRKTYILDDITPTKDNIEFLNKAIRDDADKRKTFIMDSDTNSTTNGSSPRNSSIFSHEKTTSLTTYTSDTEGESGTESAPVVLRHPQGARAGSAPNRQRYSGDYSMSSSTTSIAQSTKRGKERDIQPRYLDISKYKSESSSKNYLRRDPSKTYVSVLNTGAGDKHVSKGSAQQYEMEQKKQELEKWKRRASYDPRKAAAMGKTKTPLKTASSVLRSQSFHGPMLQTGRYHGTPHGILEACDASSDNDF